MTKLKLYYTHGGPSSRAVCLTINALNLDVECIEVNSHAGENKTAEYLLMNPQGTIPTLDDNGKYICDSHAITSYLATVYGKDSSLCPKDPYLRAVLDQRLHFEDSVLWARFGAVVTPIHLGKATEFEKDALDALLAAYDVLETYLTQNLYVVGDNLTVADFSVATDFTTAKIFIPALSDRIRYARTFAWLDRMNELSYRQGAFRILRAGRG